MADNKSLRIKDDQIEDFRNYCKNNHLTHAAGFEQMLRALELERSVNALPEQAADIEAFRQALTLIETNYINSLGLALSAGDQAREKYLAELSSKDELIRDLQSRVHNADEAAAAAEKAAQDALRAQKAAESRAKVAEQAQKNAEDRLSFQMEQLDVLQEELDAYDAKLASAEETEQKVKALQAQLKDAEHEKKLAVLDAAMSKEREMMVHILELKKEDFRLKALLPDTD